MNEWENAPENCDTCGREPYIDELKNKINHKCVYRENIFLSPWFSSLCRNHPQFNKSNWISKDKK